MVFSGNLLRDRNPSDIMLVESKYGLEWNVIDTCLYNNGHDPEIIRLDDGAMAIVFAYLKDSLQVGFSDDGVKWSKSRKFRLIDANGVPMKEIQLSRPVQESHLPTPS